MISHLADAVTRLVIDDQISKLRDMKQRLEQERQDNINKCISHIKQQVSGQWYAIYNSGISIKIK